MANIVYNIFKQKLSLGDYKWADAPLVGGKYKVMLIKVALTDPDPTTVATAISGSKEYAGSYTPTDVTGLGVTIDNVNDRVLLDATVNTTVSSVGADGVNQVVGVLLFVDPDDSDTDASSVPVAHFDITAFLGNGSNVTFVWSSSPDALVTLT